MLFILKGISAYSHSLLVDIKAHAREAQYPLTENPSEAKFFIGTMSDSFPSDTLAEKKIIVKDPHKVDTVPSKTHLFSIDSLKHLDDRNLPLSEFLKSQLK